MKKKFNGNVLVSKFDKRLITNSYGFSDFEHGILNDMYTSFGLASGSKSFVAVMIMLLVEKGLCDLNDSISKYLKFDLKKIDPNVTIHELLTHTSGIPDYFDESVNDDYESLWKDFPNYRIRSNSDLLPLFIDKEMAFERGSKFEYNNSGYVFLALIIEQITKKPFDIALKHGIFNPCKMRETDFYELDRLPGNCARSYIMEDDGSYRSNIYSIDVKGTGAGGAFSSVYDIERFWNNLFKYNILTNESVDKLFTDYGHGYGYGFWIRQTDDQKKIVFMIGEDPGVSFVSSYNLDNNITITITSNNCSDVMQIHRQISDDLW